MPDTVALPPLPGLPDVVLADPSTLAPIVPMVADDLTALAALGGAPFGLYLNGVPIITADTVMDLGYTKSYTISDFPVEQGAFASFDKVEQPFEGRIRFVAGGSILNREALITSIEAIIGDTNFYDVVTPERVYVNANVIREEFRRDNGSLLVVEVTVSEVRELAGSTGSSTADPASADPANGGTVVPTTANQSQIAAMGGTPITTPPPTLGGGVGGLPVTQTVGGIGSA